MAESGHRFVRMVVDALIDYYSRWIEIAKLTGLTAKSVITHTKSIFARYGISEVVISAADDGRAIHTYTHTHRARHSRLCGARSGLPQ